MRFLNAFKTNLVLLLLPPWCNNNLLQIVVERLLTSVVGPITINLFSQKILDKTGLEDSQICTGLLDALERHVDVL